MYPVTTRVLALALLREGHSQNAVSKSLGISRAAIREWRDRGVEPKRGPGSCFRCEPGTAVTDCLNYCALLGFYLGDGCISRTRSSFALRISCDAKYRGIISAVVVQNCWNHWPCVFPQHGPGRKHERKLTLEPWQRDLIEHHPAEFLRGLFHSDGCRVMNGTTRIVAGEKKRYDYSRWQFTNNSADIRAWCTETLDLLGIAWRRSNWKTISVSRREGAARLDELIGLKG